RLRVRDLRTGRPVASSPSPSRRRFTPPSLAPIPSFPRRSRGKGCTFPPPASPGEGEIGGGEIYAQALPLATRLHLTEIAATADGDVRFPAVDFAQWRESSRDARTTADGTAFAFVTYERVAR
ncbi:MAG: dihydrofolate reductase, partial [Burkholderiales bacterium]|nr:dihydrofolate reductase [Burkholderiales bacterium]